MRLVLLVFTLLLTACAAPAHPRVPARALGFDPMFYGGQRPIEDPDIIVATVKEVSDGLTTNANPPQVTLLVHEVLRGNLRPGSEIRAVWNERWHGIDYCDWAAIKVWEETAVEKPRVRSKHILAGSLDGEGNDSRLFINGSGKLPFTPQNRRDVVDQIAQFDAWVATEQAKYAAEERALAVARVAWRTDVSDNLIRESAAKADIVALGEIVGSGNGGPGDYYVTIRADSIIKGRGPAASSDGHPYFEAIHVDKDTFRFLDRSTTYLLLLMENGTNSARVPMYKPVPGTDGMVIADQSARDAAQQAIDGAR